MLTRPEPGSQLSVSASAPACESSRCPPQALSTRTAAAPTDMIRMVRFIVDSPYAGLTESASPVVVSGAFRATRWYATPMRRSTTPIAIVIGVVLLLIAVAYHLDPRKAPDRKSTRLNSSHVAHSYD